MNTTDKCIKEGVWSRIYPGLQVLQLDFWCSDN